MVKIPRIHIHNQSRRCRTAAQRPRFQSWNRSNFAILILVSATRHPRPQIEVKYDDTGFDIGELPPPDPNEPPEPWELGFSYGTEEWQEAQKRRTDYIEEQWRKNHPTDDSD
jgi:hypothetical protein